MQPHPPDVLEALRKYNAPTIANAIELFDIRPRNVGFMNGSIKACFPNMPPFVGYAVTAKIRAAQPPGPDVKVTVKDMYDHILSIPGPRVVVVQDLDNPPCVGSLWGEVNGNVHKALGCVAVVTDGGVRDLDEVEALGLPLFAREVIVSHAYVHLVEVGTPVTVGGLTVNPGDLLHGDKHGVIHIPHETAARIPGAVDAIEKYERVIISACQAPDFSVEKLMAARGAPRPELPSY
jgi:4-hydroxy-4-methyl-2-oxoglutarate aldolase